MTRRKLLQGVGAALVSMNLLLFTRLADPPIQLPTPQGIGPFMTIEQDGEYLLTFVAPGIHRQARITVTDGKGFDVDLSKAEGADWVDLV